MTHETERADQLQAGIRNMLPDFFVKVRHVLEPMVDEYNNETGEVMSLYAVLASRQDAERGQLWRAKQYLTVDFVEDAAIDVARFVAQTITDEWQDRYLT